MDTGHSQIIWVMRSMSESTCVPRRRHLMVGNAKRRTPATPADRPRVVPGRQNGCAPGNGLAPGNPNRSERSGKQPDRGTQPASRPSRRAPIEVARLGICPKRAEFPNASLQNARTRARALPRLRGGIRPPREPLAPLSVSASQNRRNEARCRNGGRTKLTKRSQVPEWRSTAESTGQIGKEGLVPSRVAGVRSLMMSLRAQVVPGKPVQFQMCEIESTHEVRS
jgi:hypothetical protein